MTNIDLSTFISAMNARSSDSLRDRASALPFVLDSYERGEQHSDVHRDVYIWQDRNSGLSNAPPIVKLCIESVQKFTKNYIYILLDDNNISDYVSIKNENINKIGKTPFSDYLRTKLLHDYGGIWIDATVMLTGPIPSDIVNADFFAFSRHNDPFILSSWFLAAKKNNNIVHAILKSLDKYYQFYELPYHYFMYHFMFEAAVTVHSDLADAWRNKPSHSAYPPHIMQRSLDELYDLEFFSVLAHCYWIHKLTYKHDQNTGRHTIWKHLQQLAGG